MSTEIYIDPIAEAALKHFGEAPQLAKAMEECGELIAAISRAYNGGNREECIDEIADVTIMIRQLRLIYGADLVDRRIEYKLKRIMTRIEGER